MYKLKQLLMMDDVHQFFMDAAYDQFNPLATIRFEVKLAKAVIYNTYRIESEKKKKTEITPLDIIRYKNTDTLFVRHCALALRNPVKGANLSV